MATAEWEIPFQIATPYGDSSGLGDLLLNTDLGDGREFLVNPKNSLSRKAVRANSDSVPQGDGDIFHDRFSGGMEMQFAVQLWEKVPMNGAEGRIACDEILCEMRDLLYGHLWSLLRPPNDGGRINWTPSCSPARLLDAVRLLSLADPQEGDQGAFEVTFVLDSPFPYAISAAEGVMPLVGTVFLPNDGNTAFYPVFKVNGVTTAFTITDNTTGLEYVYTSARPGAAAVGSGDYAEIDMFRGGLIYLNGDEDNLKPGVSVEASDILTVQAGGSIYTITGATATVLTHDAWV